MLAIRRLSIVGAMLLCSAVAGAARGQEYKIKLHRAEKVGDVNSISADGTDSEDVTATVQGQPPRQTSNKFTAHLTGTRKVVEVDDKGNTTKISVTIIKCTANDKSILDPGTVVVAERRGVTPTAYYVNDSSVDAATSKALKLLIDVEDPNTPNDDATFGTTDLKKVGDEWPVNSAEAAKGANANDIPVKEADIRGNASLKSVDKVDGKDVLQIAAKMDVKDIKGPGPGGMIFDSGEMKAEMSGSFPVDEAVQPLVMKSSMSLHFVGNQAAGDMSVNVDVSAKRNTKVVIGPEDNGK